jgi:aspartate 1-decarboxylase
MRSFGSHEPATERGFLFHSRGHRLRPITGCAKELQMRLTLLQAKLHRVTVTQADLEYEGSCGIDAELLEASGLRPFQYIELYNVTNGERFSTYIITAPRGSGEISLNGAAARKAMLGDSLIICAYSSFDEAEAARHKPIVVLVNPQNRIKQVL